MVALRKLSLDLVRQIAVREMREAIGERVDRNLLIVACRLEGRAHRIKPACEILLEAFRLGLQPGSFDSTHPEYLDRARHVPDLVLALEA